MINNEARDSMQLQALISPRYKKSKIGLISSSILTQPNMYARGILFGKMKYELGDHSFVRCPENNFTADIEFKTKGYFSGTYNAIGGAIKNEKTGEVYYELSGFWNGEMFIKNVTTGKKDLLFDATNAKHTPPSTRPLKEQSERESQKLWHTTVEALLARNHDAATTEKTRIEDRQREEASKRADEGIDWRPKLFRLVRGGPGGSEEGEEDLDWIANATIDLQDPETAREQILRIAAILPGQTVSKEYSIPPHSQKQHSSSNSAITNDLIDFGNDDTAALPQTMPFNSATTPHDLLGDFVNSNSIQDAQNQQGLMAPLRPTTSSSGDKLPIRRKDSHSSDTDEFVDAED
jgi:hypothetical protein